MRWTPTLAVLSSLLALGTALPAVAAPVARVLDLHVSGEAVITPLGEKVRFQLEGEPIVTITQTEDHRLVVTPGKTAGAARIILSTDENFAVWLVRLDTQAPVLADEQEVAAHKACPDLQRKRGGVEATVKTEGCLSALLPLTALLENKQVQLHWDHIGLRAQIARHTEALASLPDAASLKLGFIGVELRIWGVLTDSASLDAVRLALFDASLGPLRLDLSKLKLAR